MLEHRERMHNIQQLKDQESKIGYIQRIKEEKKKKQKCDKKVK